MLLGLERTSDRTTPTHIARRLYASFKDAQDEGIATHNVENFFQNNESEKLQQMIDKWEIEWVGIYRNEQQEILDKGKINFIFLKLTRNSFKISRRLMV